MPPSPKSKARAKAKAQAQPNRRVRAKAKPAAAPVPAPRDTIPTPVARHLRIFAFDPSVSAQLDTAGIGEITIPVRWEDKLQEGPVGEYIEVVDADPASGVFYEPVDLNDHRLLAQNGLPPSEGNPQFHQQMVYAVAMMTIGHFERALGRVALWSSRREHVQGHYVEQFVRRLRIYPHALRDRNAYYSPDKKALLFGYFPVGIKDANNSPGTLVFTCLSHDIIAHETTHALLDGVHPRFNEPVNPDVLAFHEAFADIVALFQHFSYPGVLRDQIMRTRGNLAGENLLGQLAQQFGKASGRGGALRDFLGEVGEDGKWKPRTPDVRVIDSTSEPHSRGAILVAAVFGAFLKVYRSRTVDLYRIASEGTGVLREGDIHPDLAGRLAAEAERCAQYILQTCIRAIDYCPPVGITFGDYLRAIITSDTDINPEDEFRYRVAFVESFRQWGIHARGVNGTSAESLLWPAGPQVKSLADSLFREEITHSRNAIEDRDLDSEDDSPPPPAAPANPLDFHRWNLESNRYETWRGTEINAQRVWFWLVTGAGRQIAPEVGILINPANLPPTVFRSRSRPKEAAVEVHAVRWAVRRTARGSTTTDMVVELTQRRRGYFDADEQKAKDKPGTTFARRGDDGDFIYRTGCTLLINPATMEIRRVIKTAGNIGDNDQLERVRKFFTDGMESGNAFSIARAAASSREPFALLHQHPED